VTRPHLTYAVSHTRTGIGVRSVLELRLAFERRYVSIVLLRRGHADHGYNVEAVELLGQRWCDVVPASLRAKRSSVTAVAVGLPSSLPLRLKCCLQVQVSRFRLCLLDHVSFSLSPGVSPGLLLHSMKLGCLLWSGLHGRK
jgi:hypothetical protein